MAGQGFSPQVRRQLLAAAEEALGWEEVLARTGDSVVTAVLGDVFEHVALIRTLDFEAAVSEGLNVLPDGCARHVETLGESRSGVRLRRKRAEHRSPRVHTPGLIAAGLSVRTDDTKPQSSQPHGMDAYELITRNTVEAVTDEEVRTLAEAPAGKRAYVGYEPSGVLHLGHLLTANKLIDLQEAGFEIVVLLADVHAYLNGKGTFEEIQATAERMQAQQTLLGRVLQTMYDAAVLEADSLSGSLRETAALTCTINEDKTDRIEEWWRSIASGPVQPSVVYDVGPVFIQSTASEEVSRVQEREINVERKARD